MLRATHQHHGHQKHQKYSHKLVKMMVNSKAKKEMMELGHHQHQYVQAAHVHAHNSVLAHISKTAVSPNLMQVLESEVSNHRLVLSPQSVQ